MIELAPCPWCGRKPKITDLGQVKILACEFSKCRIQPRICYTWHREDEEEAIEAWSRRCKKMARIECHVRDCVNNEVGICWLEEIHIGEYGECCEKSEVEWQEEEGADDVT